VPAAYGRTGVRHRPSRTAAPPIDNLRIAESSTPWSTGRSEDLLPSAAYTSSGGRRDGSTPRFLAAKRHSTQKGPAPAPRESHGARRLSVARGAGDQLVVVVWHELGCGVDAHSASPKALAHRVTCAGPASAPALPLAYGAATSPLVVLRRKRTRRGHAPRTGVIAWPRSFVSVGRVVQVRLDGRISAS
jgi:hypothetical protein